MIDGSFLERFFLERGDLGEPNAKGEYSVRCPFLHSSGYDQNPSASVNINKGVFHCHTCQAEGRFNEGGMSEIGFMAEILEVPYQEALLLKADMISGAEINASDNAETSWKQWQVNLFNSESMMEILKVRRGLTEETIKKYGLGYSGSGIMYPIRIFGDLMDIRTYDPDGKPKMRSQKNATTLMFPFDYWYSDEHPTLLVGGENDMLLGRQIGFNALTFTGGEGSLPKKSLLGFFKGRKVYVCYDVDAPGLSASQRVAFRLKEVGADVYVLDLRSLGLTGEKTDKDLTDLILKHNKGYAELDKLMQETEPFSEISFLEEKNKEYPLIDLWEASEGRNHGRRLSSRVIMMGKYDMDMHVPTAVLFTCSCKNKEEHTEDDCPLGKKDKMWTLGENLKDVLYLVDVKETDQTKALFNINYLPIDSCVTMKILSRETVQKVIFVPDVESNISDNFRPTEQYAFTVGPRMVDNERYRVFFRAYAHPIDKQRVYMVVDRFEASDNAVNTFEMNEPMKERLSIFQGNPFTMMKDRYERAKGLIGGYALEMLVWGTDLVYHSPLQFTYLDKLIKGYPEIAIIGESRTGKTDTAVTLQKFYRMGNYTSLKSASRAGILGGIDKLPNGGFRIKWGAVPMNNKGFLLLDEMSGVNQEIMATLTDMRSSGEATLMKMGGIQKAPAQTRMLWSGNPRMIGGRSKSLLEYPSGIEAVLDLIGADEDVARFDAIMLVIDRGVMIRPDDKGDKRPYDQDIYSDLIRWVWSRKADQVVFAENVEDYIWQRSLVLNESYATDVKLLGAEASKKLARLAVACACCCFSCDETGENIVVTNEHVDWAEYFLNRCYDDDVFRFKQYVENRRKFTTLNPDVELVIHNYMNSDSGEAVIRELIQADGPRTRFDLQILSGLDQDKFGILLRYFTKNHLIQNTSKGIIASRRLHLGVQSYREKKLRPLSER